MPKTLFDSHHATRLFPWIFFCLEKQYIEPVSLYCLVALLFYEKPIAFASDQGVTSERIPIPKFPMME